MRRRVTATARQTGPVLVDRLGCGLFSGLTSSSAGFASPSAPALECTNGRGGVLVEFWNVSCWPVSDCVCSEAVGEICWESEGSLGEGESCISRMTSGFSSDPCQGQWLRVGRSCWADSVSAVQTSAAPLPPLSGPWSKTGGAPSEAASAPPWGTAGVSVTAFARRSFRVWKPVRCFQQVFPWLLAVTSRDLVPRPFCFLSSRPLAVKPVPHGSGSPQAPVGSNQRAWFPFILVCPRVAPACFQHRGWLPVAWREREGKGTWIAFRDWTLWQGVTCCKGQLPLKKGIQTPGLDGGTS